MSQTDVGMITNGGGPNRFGLIAAGRIAPRRAAFAALTALGTAGVLILFFHDPASLESRWFPPCLFHSLTGWYCPGCGSTRAAYHLLHGHLAAAFRLNPLMVLCVPYFAYAYLTFAWHVIFPAARPHASRGPAGAHWIWSFLALVLLYWVARNVPVYPLNVLAPH
ncbi:MAG TPA: DUF2752 domain-containing protein [Tepidisphaeraceae bacterium]|nr:DUF2752 domain-containing protein [Tepidisphaeraceae bacterium]